MSAMDTAVYWTEYVIKHNGAHHLKASSVYMPWYQYVLLDVLAFLIMLSLVVITFSILFCNYLKRLILNFFIKKESTIKNKELSNKIKFELT